MAEDLHNQHTVLVVDDNEQNRALAQATLEEEGYRVLLASSGEEGLSAFREHLPDCALLDVRMPGMNGITLCQHIRKEPRGADTPVLFLTALRDVDTFDEARLAGADDFLTKPVRPTELLVRVQAALRLRRLAQENRGHYETIRSQRDDLMRLQLQKDRLMAFVVHDFKNPVNAMDLHAQLLLRDKNLSERAHQSARSIREEARTLMRLITNLLDLSKDEVGQLALERTHIEVRQLAQAVLQAFELRARAKPVSIEGAIEDCRLHGDEELLRRVLENLVDNAIRHAPAGSTVRVTTRATESELELRVADQGNGVPAELRERVFERFVQADAAQGASRGYGLGLAFCRLAVEQHGGRIWVEDGAPGAVFCVRLPHGQ